MERKFKTKKGYVAHLAKVDFDCGIICEPIEEGYDRFKQTAKEDGWRVNRDDFSYYLELVLDYHMKEVKKGKK